MTRNRLRRGLVAAAAAVLSLAVLPGVSAAACPTAPTSQVFKRWGDTAYYTSLSNGHFESGTSGWTLSKATVVSGNESFKVRSSTDSRSLSIPSGGSATSPAFCVGVEHPTFRYFARLTSGTWGSMSVFLQYTDKTGVKRLVDVGAVVGANGFTTWKPSQSFGLATILPIWATDTLSVRLVFKPETGSGTWTIDDVYIDPWRR